MGAITAGEAGGQTLSWMTPAAQALAAIAFLVWSNFGGYEKGLIVALSVLLIACPCALGLATPLTLWLSLERAAESGVIVRSTAALERLAKVKNVFFDKTGTLTQLPVNVQEIYLESGSLLPLSSPASWRTPEKGFLSIVASIENESEHPLAKAIVEYAKANQIELVKPESFKALPPLGVTGKLLITNFQVRYRLGATDVC